MSKTILNVEDAPTKEQLDEAVSRLRKDSEILKVYHSKKRNDANPESLTAVANFLEMLRKRLEE